MGSLQTEIQKTLNSWNPKPELPATVVDKKDPIAKQVFDYVKINPTCTANDVVRDLPIDVGRASATLLNLYNRGKLERKEYPNPDPNGTRLQVFCYWAAVDNYTDKSESRTSKKAKKAKQKTVERLLKSLDAEEPRIEKQKSFDPETFVKGLSLTEVKQLHKFLESYFE